MIFSILFVYKLASGCLNLESVEFYGSFLGAESHRFCFTKDVIFNDLRQIIERDQLQGLHPAEAEWKELFEI